MLQYFLTVMTIFSIAFHATVGCFAHHSHTCSSDSKYANSKHADLEHAAQPEETAVGRCCSHDHGDSVSALAKTAHLSGGDSNREYFEGRAEPQDHHDHSPCVDDHCNFVLVHRDQDVHRLLTFSKWCQVLGSDSIEIACDSRLPIFGLLQNRPLDLTGSSADRAAHQVWLL
ncbi:hypothetical protein KOR42_33800 [Thalassoglobus neptunius]|uniref:Secreted protein n=1 Tax=Thalassoglobus neptunius TaxID=1938619 RepID=A0A5C5WLM8_9PLAN|nr:hypothetical protein KOR42_33800 [Thalassoglobus neptunius]